MSEVIVGHADLPAYGIHYSRPHLIRLEKQSLFPRRMKLSPGRVGWLKSEIETWIADRAAARATAAT
jgi:prophage regulatory protein